MSLSAADAPAAAQVPVPADPARAFLGVGWAFPPRLQPDGRIAEAAYEERRP